MSTDVYRLQEGDAPLILSIPHSGTALAPGVEERLTEAALLLPDTVKVSKLETVVVLIALILALGWLANMLLPPMAEPWRTVLTVAVNVCLISYLFLPWSIRLLVAIRKRLLS